MLNLNIRQGDIFLVDFGRTAIGHEYRKKRPALIIHSNRQLAKLNLITVMPFTSRISNQMPDDVLVCGDKKNLLLNNSFIKTSHIMTFDKQRFIYKIGEVSEDVLAKVKKYLIKHFDIQ